MTSIQPNAPINPQTIVQPKQPEAKSKEKSSISTGVKVAVGAGLTALAAAGIYNATKGKGGKKQYQRILPHDIEFIKQYFDAVNENEHVFDRKYFENDLNLHSLRAAAAREYYFAQLQKIKENPKYAEQLEKEIRNRWTKMNLTKNSKPKRFKEVELQGTYTLRGKNRELALQKGLPVHYNKVALLATSIFKLSHWRNDVTIASYMLA